MATQHPSLSRLAHKGVFPTRAAGSAAATPPGVIGHIGHLEGAGEADQADQADHVDPAAAAATVPAASTLPPAAAAAPRRAADSESPLSRAALQREIQQARQERPRVYEAAPSPFASAVREQDRAAMRDGRRDMHSAKIVARLVAAIARKPGSGVPNPIKSQYLTTMLRRAREAGERIAAYVAPSDAHRGWVQAMATEAAVTIVAGQWESDPDDEMLPVESQVDILEEVFRRARSDEGLALAMERLGESAEYVEADGMDIAEARLRVSASAAAWKLYGYVVDASLGHGAFRYHYDRTPADIVARLLPDVIAIARDNQIATNSLDLRTAHLQGSIGRVADLMGAEYVSRTRQIMNWISEVGISEEDYAARLQTARGMFESKVVPNLVEWTRRNFEAVEALASKLMEVNGNAQVDSQRRGR